MAVMHRDDMVEAATAGDLERVDVQLQRNLPDVNHINQKVVCHAASSSVGPFLASTASGPDSPLTGSGANAHTIVSCLDSIV